MDTYLHHYATSFESSSWVPLHAVPQPFASDRIRSSKSNPNLKQQANYHSQSVGRVASANEQMPRQLVFFANNPPSRDMSHPFNHQVTSSVHFS